MQMRPSKVLAKMRAGEVANTVKSNLADPRVIDIMGMCGFDSVWVCQEHVPNTLHDIENQIRAAKMHDMDIIVRVPRGSYSDLIYPLEMDATAIMVPHVMSAEDARQIAYYSKFYPVGRRPWDGGNSDGAYCMLPPDQYMKQANEERMVIAQIEDPEPLEELEEIAQVDGIDMLFFGPGDFSQGIGAPGQWDHPMIAETRKRIAEVARKYGKFAGTVGSVDNFDELAAMGYQLINVSSDVVPLWEKYNSIMEKLGKSAGPTSRSIYGGKAK